MKIFEKKADPFFFFITDCFLLYLSKIRKDLVKGVLVLKSRFQILSWLCLFFTCFFEVNILKVNKKQLAEIFGRDARTITTWQSQGLPMVSGGGKGVEAFFDTTEAIEWYTERDAAIENEKLRKEVDDLRAAAESDLVPGSIDYERYRLTRAQADAQELKNAERKSEVMDIELFTYILQRIAQEIVGILSRLPLTLQRRYPDLTTEHIDAIKTEIAKASDKAATIADVEKWVDDFRRASGE